MLQLIIKKRATFNILPLKCSGMGKSQGWKAWGNCRAGGLAPGAAIRKIFVFSLLFLCKTSAEQCLELTWRNFKVQVWLCWGGEKTGQRSSRSASRSSRGWSHWPGGCSYRKALRRHPKTVKPQNTRWLNQWFSLYFSVHAWKLPRSLRTSTVFSKMWWSMWLMHLKYSLEFGNWLREIHPEEISYRRPHDTEIPLNCHWKSYIPPEVQVTAQMTKEVPANEGNMTEFPRRLYNGLQEIFH